MKKTKMSKLLSFILAYIAVNILLFAQSSSTSNSLLLGNLVKKNNQIASWKIGSFIFPKKNESLQFQIKFFAPVQPGAYPVIFFLTGLNGFAPTLFYNEFCESLALKTGSIVTVFDGFEFPKLPDKEERIFELTLNWTTMNIIDIFSSSKTPESVRGKVFPDLKSGSSLMSHSAAGHTVVSYLVRQCGFVNSLIMLDPVDGYDPFGYVKQFVTNPPQQLNFAIPTLIAASGLSSVPKSAKFPPCAPTNLSNVRFYDSLPGPTWFMNFTTYGHADVLNAIGKKIANIICKPCQINCETDTYQDNLLNALTYFLLGIRDKNPEYLNAIQEPEKYPGFDTSINILAFNKYNGFDVMKTGPFCQRL